MAGTAAAPTARRGKRDPHSAEGHVLWLKRWTSGTQPGSSKVLTLLRDVMRTRMMAVMAEIRSEFHGTMKIRSMRDSVGPGCAEFACVADADAALAAFRARTTEQCSDGRTAAFEACRFRCACENGQAPIARAAGAMLSKCFLVVDSHVRAHIGGWRARRGSSRGLAPGLLVRCPGPRR